MSTSPLVVFGSWIAQAGKLDEVINVASCVIDYARENPEELLSVYLLRGVLDKTPGHEVRLVCWFANKQSYQKYLLSSTIVNLKILCENNRLLQTSQVDRIVSPRAGFIRRLETHHDPCVVIASVRFKREQRKDGLALFSTIANAVEAEEKGAYTYLFMEDVEDEGLLWSFERYIDEQFLRETHIMRDDIQENIDLQKEMRQPGGLHHWYWKQIAEFQAPGI